MELICRAPSYLEEEKEQLLLANHINIEYKAKLSPLYILEANDIDSVKNLKIFESVSISPIFKLADITLNPSISNKTLIKRMNAVGWGIKVGVIDSGILPEIINTIYSKDFTPYGNKIINNHGTHVAKIIEYFAPGAQICSFKVAHHGHDITGGAVIQALDDAIDQQVDIINMSLGACQECKGDCSFCNYVNLVSDQGIVVVAAAGNSGRKKGNTIDCPGAAEQAITVGSLKDQNNLDESSGKGIPGFNKPNLLAPGYVNVTMRYKSGITRESNSGTSFAAPVVSGILSALFSKYPDRGYIITKMYETCKSISLPRHHQGFGKINLPKLLEVVSNDETISDTSKG